MPWMMNMKMLKCPLYVKYIRACVKVGEIKIPRSLVVSQMNGNPTLSKDCLTWIKVGIAYMKPKLLTTTHHDNF